MELGQTPRPASPVSPYTDDTPRKKCTFCCATRCALLVGGAAFLVGLPFNAVATGGRLCEGKGWRGFCNRNLMHALPMYAITFTHQLLMSESLWSKHRKTVWQINVSTSVVNIVLWSTALIVCTPLSRRYLPRWSREYRLNLWEYRRLRRSCANRYLPSITGRITEDLDWYNIAWGLALYHTAWGFVSIATETVEGAYYGMLFQATPYSRWCSPRWREWRELEVKRRVHTVRVVGENRWGNFLSNNRWNVRNDP